MYVAIYLVSAYLPLIYHIISILFYVLFCFVLFRL